jgi:hypothetical protein
MGSHPSPAASRQICRAFGKGMRGTVVWPIRHAISVHTGPRIPIRWMLHEPAFPASHHDSGRFPSEGSSAFSSGTARMERAKWRDSPPPCGRPEPNQCPLERCPGDARTGNHHLVLFCKKPGQEAAWEASTPAWYNQGHVAGPSAGLDLTQVAPCLILSSTPNVPAAPRLEDAAS